MSTVAAPTAARPTAPAERSATRSVQRPSSTLEDLILGAWEELAAGQPAECPVCGGRLSPLAGCNDCGSRLG